MFKKNIRAFTLAEILITLLVIGIVASTCIPALINDTQDKEFHVAWKSNFQIINDAARRVVHEYGGDLSNICDTGDIHTDSECMRNKFLDYLSASKICSFSTSNGNCFDADGKTYEGGIINFDTFNGAGLILNNGTLVQFYVDAPNCDKEQCCGVINTCGALHIDTNGFKGPARLGKDIFKVRLMKTGIVPYGANGDGYGHTCYTAGLGCAAAYLMQ